MSTIGTAYVQILPSAQGISQRMEQGIAGPSMQAGKKGGMIMSGAMAKYISGAAIGTAIVSSVKEGAKLEQAIGGVETLYKDAWEGVVKSADNAYKELGIASSAYMEQATSFAAGLTNALGGDTRAAAKYADMAIRDMSDNANKMGTDVTMLQNAYQGFAKQNYTMLDNLKLGYGGTKEGMQQLLSDAEKISGQEYDISNLADVYEAIHVVQEEMGITGTSAKEAATTLSGSFNSMKSAAQNFLGNLALGRNIAPSLNGLVESTSTFLLDNLIPAVLNIAKALPQALFTFWKQGLPSLAAKIPGLIKQIFGTSADIVNQLTEFINGLATKASKNPEAFIKAGADLIGKIVTGFVKGEGKLLIALGKLALSIPGAIKNIAGGLISSVVETIKSKIGNIVGVVKAKFNAVKDAILSPLRSAKNAIKTVINEIKKIFTKVRLKLGLKIPKISISGGKAPWGIAGKGKLPSFKVKWAAKGGIVDGATLIGAGEKGKEAIVPLDPFWKKLDERKGALDYEKLAAVMIKALSGMEVRSTVDIDGKTIAQTAAPFIRKELDVIDKRNNRKLGYV